MGEFIKTKNVRRNLRTGVIDKFERKKKPSRYALPLRAEVVAAGRGRGQAGR